MLGRDDAGGASSILVNRSGIGEFAACMDLKSTMEAAQVVISLIPGIPKIDTPFAKEALRIIL